MKIGWLVALSWGTLAAPGGFRITIYDQAHLPPEVIESAVGRLRLILQQSGIAVEPVMGDPAADEASLFTYVSAPGGHEQEAAALPETVLGMASPLAPTGLNVRVFNDHVRQAASEHNRPYAIVLSYVIAHEIGHVLLKSSAHANGGIMSAVWTARDYAQMADTAAMYFTSDESAKMLENLRRME